MDKHVKLFEVAFKAGFNCCLNIIKDSKNKTDDIELIEKGKDKAIKQGIQKVFYENE